MVICNWIKAIGGIFMASFLAGCNQDKCCLEYGALPADIDTRDSQINEDILRGGVEKLDTQDVKTPDNIPGDTQPPIAQKSDQILDQNKKDVPEADTTSETDEQIKAYQAIDSNNPPIKPTIYGVLPVTDKVYPVMCDQLGIEPQRCTELYNEVCMKPGKTKESECYVLLKKASHTETSQKSSKSKSTDTDQTIKEYRKTREFVLPVYGMPPSMRE